MREKFVRLSNLPGALALKKTMRTTRARRVQVSLAVARRRVSFWL
jgi:hypothetical protein